MEREDTFLRQKEEKTLEPYLSIQVYWDGIYIVIETIRYKYSILIVKEREPYRYKVWSNEKVL